MVAPLSDDEISELARLFPADATTRTWLRWAGFEAAALPSIVAEQAPYDYWLLISQKIVDGTFPPDSRERIVAMACRQFPYNRVLCGGRAPTPWRVLHLGASPAGPQGGAVLGEVEASREYREILDACDPKRAQLDVRYVPYTTVDDFDQIGDWRPHVLHLSCHGDNGALILHERPVGAGSSRRAARVVPIADVVDIVAAYARHTDVRLAGIVLNACRSVTAAEALVAHAEVVIAHRDDLPVEGAISFTRALYARLRGAASLDVAAELAIAHLKAADDRAWRVTDGVVIRRARR